MPTRLNSRLSSFNFPLPLRCQLRSLRGSSLVTIGGLSRPALTGLGQTLQPLAGSFIIAQTMDIGTKPSSRRDLSKELEDGIKPWTGPSIFTTPKAKVRGSIASPIDITSSPETEVVQPRVRGVVRYTSDLPRTAFTPPKVHPFFTHQRARTAPLPPVPASQRPRLVAQYSSTEASSSTSQSQSQSQDTQSTFGSVEGKGKGKQKEQVTAVHVPPPEWAEEAIDQISKDLAKTRITTRIPLKSRSTIPAPGSSSSSARTVALPPKSAPTRPTHSKLEKGKGKQSDAPTLPFFHHADLPNPPRVAYTTSSSEADDLLSCLKGDIFGFDLEWPPAGKYTTTHPTTGVTSTHWIGRKWDTASGKYVFTPGRTALVQVCDKGLIVLIHLKDMKGE